MRRAYFVIIALAGSIRFSLYIHLLIEFDLALLLTEKGFYVEVG